MSTTAKSPRTTSEHPDFAMSRSAVEDFYARQFALLDSGRVDDWIDSFDAEATFVTPRASAAGREAIRQATQRGADTRQEQGVVHRHLQTALTLEPQDEDLVIATSYVLVVQIDGQGVGIHCSSVCTDHLILRDGRLHVAARIVDIDGR